MSFESIKEMLKTVHFYNTVNITQSFSSEDGIIITARCLKNTNILEVTFPVEPRVVQFTSTEEAADAIFRALSSNELSTNS